MSHELTWLLVAIPAVSAAILLLGGKATNAWGHLLGTAASLASFVCGALLFFQMQGLHAEERSETVKLFEWFSVGSVHVDVTLLVDQLSILFVLLITGVGSLIHIYSIGYMAHDARRRRFFGYLNLFVASMLLLVLAADYLLVFVGWEGVGLASYLLIGFWQHKHSAATAAKKAFVVNRVGDIGLSLAVMSMWALFGSSAFTTVNEGVEGVSSTWATLLGLMLLLAACGKSAQVPLQSWLLDAMEGPTPVLGADPRGDHGHRGRLPGGSLERHLRGHRRGLDRGGDRRHGDRAGRCGHRLRQGRHQEGAGRFDDEPDRLHDARRRSRPGGLRVRDLPPARPTAFSRPTCSSGPAR